MRRAVQAIEEGFVRSRSCAGGAGEAVAIPLVGVLCSLLCLIWVSTAAAQVRAGSVGVIAALEGEVWVSVQGRVAPARLYQELFQGDRVGTGERGKAKILFIDDSMADLGTMSELEITDYHYRPDVKERRSLLWLSQGRLRFLVTKFFVERKADFRLQTPSAVVGVRGTEGILHVQNPTMVFCLSGLLEVLNPSTGESVDLGPLTKALVERDRPMTVESIDPKEVPGLRIEFQISGRPSGTGPAGPPVEPTGRTIGPSQDMIQEITPREPGPPERPPEHHH
jgi:hypothetical protein